MHTTTGRNRYGRWYALVSVAVFLSGLPLVPSRGDAPLAGKMPTFERDVLPLLKANCLKCHGGDARKGGLDLRNPASMLAGGDNGPVLVKGSAEKSLLSLQVSNRKMPPGKAAKLSDAQVAVVRDWINAGAPGGSDEAGFWAFRPVVRPPLPSVQHPERVRTPIDAFVLAKLEEQGFTFAADADRATLLRRVTFDLLGLPPSPAEIDAFLADERPDAYERVVDRLLASPQYGERWGRHWLDVARFGESQGYERDKLRDNAWPYRDYVIRSFNDDKPYPQFVKEQLAGDVLEPATREGLLGTGFLVAGPWDEVGQTQQGMLMRLRVREEELEEMIGAVGQTFLGLTVNCARCHNHKFDPIPQRDYYRLKAALEGVRHGDRPLLTPKEKQEQEARIAQLTKRIGELEKEIASLEQAGRERVSGAGKADVEGVPVPIARWTFDADARDSLGSLHGTLHGGAAVANGRLRLDGKTAFVQTAPLPRDLREKTLEAWVTLANLTQRGGGVMTVETKNGGVFDSIVFGEREPGRWMAGSEGFRRTQPLNGPAETARPDELVHVAIVYSADDRITFYRDGSVHGTAYTPSGPETTLRKYEAGESQVLFGRRHTGGGNAFFAGEIEEARLYDRALTATEIAASGRAAGWTVPLERVLAALTPEQRQRRAAAVAELQLGKLGGALTALQAVPVAYVANSKPPDPTFVLLRGDIEKKSEQVTAGALSAVKTPSPDFGLPPEAPEGERRLKLAEWIANADNPLTARVLVNRVWHYHFGNGIVGTPNDFGINGEPPSHPELLDWLVMEFIARGWSIKQLHRLIVLSTTYRQGAAFNDRAAAMDGDNRLLWRFAPRRLEAEAVRDEMLAVSGQLNQQIGGPSFRPFTVTVFNSTFYNLTDPIGPEYNRRTVYRINVNSAKSPLLESLDCPDPSVKTPRRSVTTTPLQALGLMNNSFVLRQARGLAERIHTEAGDNEAAKVEQAYRLAFGRKPTETETQRALALAKEHGMESVCWVLLNASEFMYLR